MKTALLGLLSSKKFWTLLLGLITAIAAKVGFEVDPEIYWGIVTLTGVLIGAQGLTDHGKEKAAIENRNVQSGFASLDLLFAGTAVALALIALSIASCATIKSETKAAAKSFVDCGKPQLIEAAGELGSVLEPAVEQLLSDTGHVDKAGWKSLTRELKSDAAGCAIAAVVSRLTAPRDQGAPFASPLTVDAAELQATWADTRREQFGGRTFELGAGS